MPQRGIERGRRLTGTAGRILVLATISLMLGAPCWAQEVPRDNPERRVARMVQDASRALQAGNAASFLRFFDRTRFSGYPTLESHIVALTTQSDIASSIDLVEIERTEDGYRLRVDWLLQLSVKDTTAPLETRREVLRIDVGEERKERWRITILEPLDFFRPQGASRE